MFLFPLLPLQGMLTRKRAMRLPEASGARTGGDSGGLVVVLGDSVVAGVGIETTADAMPAQLTRALGQQMGKPLRWRAIGSNGHKLQDVLVQLKQLEFLEEAPELIVINVGVNDVSNLTSLTRWQLQLTTLVSEVKSRFSAPLLLLGLPPMHAFPLLPQPLRFALGTRARMLDLSLKKIAGLLENVFYLQADLPLEPEFMAVDGYHPSAAGVQVWTESLAQQYRQLQDVS